MIIHKNKYQIKIELLSDLCVADGGVYNSALDIDICRDKFGFPYIPAKRLRGCLRECALELNDWGENINIIALFGDKDNKEAAICLNNAYLEQYDVMKQVAVRYRGNVLLHEQNILNHFSYIRTQTEVDYKTGAAAEKSLRTMRVVNKGLVFYADLEWNVEEEKKEVYEEQLALCCAALRHLGMARTRGLGEVKVSLEKKKMCLTEQMLESEAYLGKNTTANDVWHENKDVVCLKYTLFLDEPVICKTVQAGEMKTMDYIDGSKILGLIAQGLKDKDVKAVNVLPTFMEKGELRCTNAYPAWNGNRMTEVPACFYAIKNNKKEYVDKAYESWKTSEQENAEKTLQLNAMKHCYVLELENGMQKYSVEVERRYHHRRPENKAIGRAVEMGSDSNFYQISSIAAGQSFSGLIYGSTEQIKEIYELFSKKKYYYLGASKHSEYGKVSFLELELCNLNDSVQAFQKKEKVEEKEYLFVKLEAPTILYNDKAMYSIDTKVLIEEVNVVLGLPKETMPVKQYINYTTVGGFHVTWGYRKPTLDVFDKGTVLIYEIDGQISCPAAAFLGERAEEGYGEFSVRKITKPEMEGLGSWRTIYKQTASVNRSDITKSEREIQNEIGVPKIDFSCLDEFQQKYIESICKQLLKEFIRMKASKAAKQKKPDASWRPTVNNMLFICKEIAGKLQSNSTKQLAEETVQKTQGNDMVAQVKQVIDERYGKKGAGKDKKREIADEIIGHIEEISKIESYNSKSAFEKLSLIQEFEKLYAITGLSCDLGEILYQYLEAYLLELKYSIRSMGKFEKKEETAND